RECDEGILEAVQTLLWATPRAEQVKELVLIRDQLAFRYGKEFVLEAMENKSSHVNARVIAKMQVNAPDIYLVEGYLEEIARTYDIEWVSNVLSQEQSSDESDVDGNTAVVTPLQKSMAQSSSPDLDLPDIPINLLLAGVSKPKEEKEKRGSFDDLAKRLEALKKR
ncbi:regulator of Vps4 activity in the MVB pathway-domain-containing protein, partial [Spinellus fusiger]